MIRLWDCMSTVRIFLQKNALHKNKILNNIIWKHDTFAYHPHTVYVFRTNISESVPNRHHCLERYFALDRQLAFLADFFRLCFISSRHLCLRSSPTSAPAASVILSRLAPPLLEGEGSHFQRPASDVFYSRFAELHVVRGGSMMVSCCAPVVVPKSSDCEV